MEEENLEMEGGREAATYRQLSKLSVDDALNILAQNAIKEFGYAPRDFCRGVFNLQLVREDHDDALNTLSFDDLQGFVEAFSKKHIYDTQTSHRILEVYPQPPNVRSVNDKWTIDFKTDHIKKRAFSKMRTIEVQHVRDTYRLFRNNPIASAYAGSLFELIIHGMLTLGCRSTPELQPEPLICMSTIATSAADAPIFTSNPPTSFSTPAFGPLFKSRRTKEFDFANTVENHVTLEENVLYLPTSRTNPLFDSFTIDIIEKTVTISIFQITISGEHGGSSKGYLIIRNIMSRVRQLIKGTNITNVKVAYFLICCSDSDRSHFQWDMPVGWTKKTKINDHRGEVFYVKVPV